MISQSVVSTSYIAVLVVTGLLSVSGCREVANETNTTPSTDSSTADTKPVIDVGSEVSYRIESTNPDGSRVVQIDYVIEIPRIVTRVTKAADGTDVAKEFKEMMLEYRTQTMLVPAGEDIQKYLRGRKMEIVGDFEFRMDKDDPDFEPVPEAFPGSVLEPEVVEVTTQRPGTFDPRLNRVSFLSYVGKPREAIAMCEQVLGENVDNVEAVLYKAHALYSLGDYEECMKDYNMILRMHPDDLDALNGAAWTLATCPDESIRNGDRSVELATSACKATNFEDGYLLDTLAASYAEAGNFEKAVEISQRSVELIQDAELKEHCQARLDKFRERKPFRETSPERLSSQISAIKAMKEIDILKKGALDFDSASPDAKAWWESVEMDLQDQLPALLNFCQQAVARDATIHDIFLASSASKAETLDGVLQWLDAKETAIAPE